MSFAAAAALSSSTANTGKQMLMRNAKQQLPIVIQELTLTCSDGIQLAAQEWTYNSKSNKHDNDSQSSSLPSSTPKVQLPRKNILCLHGWMDNAASFHQLAPRLLQRLSPKFDTRLVALDFPGHGWSTHKSADGPPTLLAESVFYVAEALRLLKWTMTDNGDGGEQEGATSKTDDPLSNNDNNNNNKITLIGHSMGAAVSSIYAAAFDEHVDQLVLLDGGAPLPRRTHDTIRHIRAHVDRRQAALLQQSNHQNKPPRVYPSLELAIQTRRMTAKKFPGNQSLSYEAARDLCVRGTRPHLDNDNNAPDGAAAGVVFRHDPRLQWPTIQYWTADMNRVLYETLASRSNSNNNNNSSDPLSICLLLAEQGWPRTPEDLQSVREVLAPSVMETLPGSHHFHADPETAEAVADQVAAFLLGQHNVDDEEPQSLGQSQTA